MNFNKSAAQGGGYILNAYESGNVYADNNLSCGGTLSKGGGSFKIDHPLDPENKYLYHSFVESPDMMNVYNGNVQLDENGEATVEMEDWFEALNRDFRYQLTPIGAAAMLYVAEEITGQSFKIAGGVPNMKVSWQVTGIRQDPFANENRIPTEVEKEDINKGKYLHADAWSKVKNKPLVQGVNINEADIESYTEYQSVEKPKTMDLPNKEEMKKLNKLEPKTVREIPENK